MHLIRQFPCTLLDKMLIVFDISEYKCAYGIIKQKVFRGKVTQGDLPFL